VTSGTVPLFVAVTVEDVVELGNSVTLAIVVGDGEDVPDEHKSPPVVTTIPLNQPIKYREVVEGHLHT
jgi:hypothetical protein